MSAKIVAEVTLSGPAVRPMASPEEEAGNLQSVILDGLGFPDGVEVSVSVRGAAMSRDDIKIGQFYRTEDGCEAVIVEELDTDTVFGYGLLCGTIGTIQTDRASFAKQFPVLVFTPTPMDGRGNPMKDIDQ